MKNLVSAILIWPQPATDRAGTKWYLVAGINAALLALWLWLYRPVFEYLTIIFSREDFRTNQFVLIGVLVLIGIQVRRGRLRPRIDAPPQCSLTALALILGGSTLYLLVERYLDINTISASLFGLASYGLLGLWMTPRRWRRGLPAMLLLIGALPFGEHMQTFVGYPVRILTAAIVRDGLTAAGIHSVGIDTILVLENGISHIDLPCSGVKSLWTGALFLLAATWIERRPLGIRWGLLAVMFSGLLLIANVARVAILVVVGQVAGLRLVAEMLHVPLGVLGFVGACAVALVLLRRLPPIRQHAWRDQDLDQPAAFDRPIWLAPALGVVIVTMIVAYTPRPESGLSQPVPAWDFPSEFVTKPMPLTPDEYAWLTRDGADSADRRRFEWRDVSGSMILITSTTWRAHHRPERCFEVYGLTVDDSSPYLVTTDFPLRLVSLGRDDARNALSASYWFQSAGQTTDDYATRIWADLTPRRDRWVLVSILFDDRYDPGDMQDFYIALHEAVQRSLDGG